MTRDDLFNVIFKQLPELKDKLQLQHIQYDEGRNRALFFFHADVLVEKASFDRIRKVLQGAFQR